MAEEIIVPRRGNTNLELGGIPKIQAMPLVQPSQFSAPPQVEWTAPARTNELMQVSEALADLNPQLKAFGTAYIRNDAVEDVFAKKMAQEDANLLSIEQARNINRKSIQEGIKEGWLKPEQLPQYYTELQRVSAQREARSDYRNFILTATDNNGKLKFIDRLQNGLSSEDPYAVLEEASNEWLNSYQNSSQIGRSSAKDEIIKINQEVADQTTKNRWENRRTRMEETLAQAGQDILMDVNLNDRDKQEAVQGWLKQISDANVPGAFNKWAEGSLQPYILRLAKVNPDKARTELNAYENIQTQTGAKLGGGGNFATFQSLYAKIDDFEDKESKNNELNRAKDEQALSDRIVNVVYNTFDKYGGDVDSLLDPKIQAEMEQELFSNPIEAGERKFLLDETPYTGKARKELAKQVQDLVRLEYREDPELLSSLKIAIQEGDSERVEGIIGAVDANKGWGRTYTSSKPWALQELNKIKEGSAIVNNPFVKDATQQIQKSLQTYLYGQAGGKDTDDALIAGQALLQIGSDARITQDIQTAIKSKVEEVRKEDPNKTQGQIIQENIQTIASEVQKTLSQEAFKKFEQLQNNVKESATIETGIRENEFPTPDGFIGSMFKETDSYQGQRMESIPVLQNRFNKALKRKLQLVDAGLSENNPALPDLMRRNIAEYTEQRNRLSREANNILPRLAKDIVLGGYTGYATREGANFVGGQTFIKYDDATLAKKGQEYFQLKGLIGYTPKEVANGKTIEGLPLPLDPKMPEYNKFRNLTTHFQGSQELDQAIQEYAQSTSKESTLLGRMFKSLQLQGDDEEDSYVQQQAYLLKLLK
jgi:hypothetical protein